MIPKKKLTLKVIFDTNVIYIGSANELLRKEVIDLLNNHASLSDIDIEWYLPEIVIKERIFQMNKKGVELLPSIQKLEKLLGHNLNINEEIVRNRINETVNKQIESNSLHTIKLDTTKVNWDSIIHNSLNRQPPFEDSEKEKGFRDALILECFKQIIQNSPTTKRICRIAFITNDGLLKDAATQTTTSNSNVNIYSNIDELVSLINILNSEITEELINAITNEARKTFFEKDNQATLYYSEKIYDQINNKFSVELYKKQEGVDIKENGTWWINNPGFVKKTKQRVFWKTIISIEFVNFKTTYEKSLSQLLNLSGQNQQGSGFGSEITNLPRFGGFNNETPNPFLKKPEVTTKKEKLNEGKTRFEVMWSVTLTTNRKLKNPKLESIKFLDIIT